MRLCILLLVFIFQDAWGQTTWKWEIGASGKYTNQSQNFTTQSSAIATAAFLSDDIVNANYVGDSDTTAFCNKYSLNSFPYSCVGVGSDKVKVTIQHDVTYTIKNSYVLRVLAKKNDENDENFENIQVNNINLTNSYQSVWGPKNGTDNSNQGYENVSETIPISFEIYIKGQNFNNVLDNSLDFIIEVEPL